MSAVAQGALKTYLPTYLPTSVIKILGEKIDKAPIGGPSLDNNAVLYRYRLRASLPTAKAAKQLTREILDVRRDADFDLRAR